MPFQPTEPEVAQVLLEMHPDPFVQAAILRVYQEAPDLLDELTAQRLTDAYDAHTQAAYRAGRKEGL